MTTKLSLSIGIPMYNHERTIRTTLDSIFSQLDDIKDICDLEVVISDNCSTDKSPEIIKTEYLPKYPEILKYYRNDENIGLERNVLKVLELSTHEYVWWLGDDKFIDGAFRNLYNAIMKAHQRPIVIMTNGRVSFDVTSDISNSIADGREITQNNVYCQNIDNIPIQCKSINNIINSTAIFRCIVRREDAIKIEADFCNNYPHADIILRLIQDKPFVFINKFCVISQTDSWTIHNTKADICLLNTITFYNIVYNIYHNIYKYIDGKNFKAIRLNTYSKLLLCKNRITCQKQYIDIVLKIRLYSLCLHYTLKVANFLSPKLAFKVLVRYAKIHRDIKKLRFLHYLTIVNSIVLLYILLH